MIGTLLAMAAGAAITVAPVVAIAAFRPARLGERDVAGGSGVGETVRAPSARWRRLRQRARALRAAATAPDMNRRQQRLRALGWSGAGITVWVVSGWPAAGITVTVVGLWAPWLLGSARVVRDRIERLEAVEAWCRRMADVLSGGGSVGLAQAITTSARHVDQRIAPAVTTLSIRLRDGEPDLATSVREFAAALDDRVGDTVAAALLLALHEQSGGVGQVLRQLAEGVARDVRERRRIEAERAESRQSIRMLLLIQAAVLAMLALVPTFAAAYTSPGGQLVMAVLLAATVGLLVWMRRLALGRPAPRFLSGHTHDQISGQGQVTR